VEGRPVDAGYVAQVGAWDLSLPWRAWLGLARLGAKPRGKPKGSCSAWGPQVRGRLGWVNGCESSSDVSSPPHPGAGCCAGVNRSWPLGSGRRRPGTAPWSRRYRCSRGTEDTRAWPYLRRAERGNPVGVRCSRRRGRGKPTVRGAEVPGGNRMPKKRMPVAERQQESGAAGLVPPLAGSV
jgi:hypothetical protein